MINEEKQNKISIKNEQNAKQQAKMS